MGQGQLDSASYFEYGRPDGLSFFDMPVHGTITTSSPSGITDSAASATAMATGALTWNGRVGLDLDEQPVQNLVELAKEYGMATGIVTTTRISHATPACFVAHVKSRGQYQDIAKQMVALRPDVMLGGGRADFEAREDDRNLSEELQGAGYDYVQTAAELASSNPAEHPHLLGLFADSHLTYRSDRAPDSELPYLKDMAVAALERLDADPEGFFLMVEGGRIDHAGHQNNVVRSIGETLGFEDTVAAVRQWADGRDDVTILVSADHETGGLRVLAPSAAGEVPLVSWRWGSHTNTSVHLFGQGPGSASFDNQVRDHRWVHSAFESLIRNRQSTPPPKILPDGRLGDLRGPSVVQTQEATAQSNARLSRLSLDSDARGLGVGIEGLFPWNEGATLILIDVDYGEGTGLRDLAALNDIEGSVDQFLSRLALPASTDSGLGIDLAFLTQGGLEPKFEQILDSAGLRGLRAPYGSPTHLGELKAATNFSDNSRIYGPGQEVISGQGLEIFIRWQELYDGATEAPPGTRIAIWALQLGGDASATSQSLPPWEDASASTVPPPLILSL